MKERQPIPRLKEGDYTEEAAQKRRDFIKEQTGASLDHCAHYSIDPSQVQGNTENFFGVVQMPLGVAGPCLINGQHAKGWFYVPMATTEGTLVASYSRGMRLLSDCGGVKATVVEEFMQRAPVFEFADARDAKEFSRWLKENLDTVTAKAGETTRIGELKHIQQWQIAKLVYTRFNFTTGDAAGQNMTGKATRHACLWILDNFPGKIVDFRLSGGIETDKKHSYMNLLHTRGKRVVAECVLDRDLLWERMRVDTEQLFRMRQRSMVGSVLAGSAYNGPHSANGIAAMFIATGQDEANVVESHTGISFMDLDEDKNLYYSVTLPSVICATHGGGTGLPSQRECLRMLGCEGPGSALKLAEIIGATVLAGDVSLAAAVLADEWVSSHDALGRNR